MRHNVRGRKLNRSTSHRKAMFRNMVSDLFKHERITTTTQKAKEARSLAERLITYAKAGDLNSRRMAARKLYDPKILQKLFDELGPRYKDRPGGYTRVLKLDGPRKGDNADMSILELVEADYSSTTKKAKPAAAAAPVVEDVAAEEVVAEEVVAEEVVEETATEATEADDLTKIEGVGPKFAKGFQAVGVNTYADLAAKSVDELKALLEANEEYASLAGRINDSWPQQAGLAAEGKWDELKTLQDELNAGK